MKQIITKIFRKLSEILLKVRIIRAPNLSLERVCIHYLSIQEVSFTIFLTIDNPNIFGIKILSLDYQIFFGNFLIAEGATFHPDSDFKIQRFQGSIIEIPISFHFSPTQTTLRTIFLPGNTNYRIEAKINIKSPFGILPIHIKKIGAQKIPLPEIPSDIPPSVFDRQETPLSLSIH